MAIRQRGYGYPAVVVHLRQHGRGRCRVGLFCTRQVTRGALSGRTARYCTGGVFFLDFRHRGNVQAHRLGTLAPLSSGQGTHVGNHVSLVDNFRAQQSFHHIF